MAKYEIGKWTSGSDPILDIESTAGTWRAKVDTDDASWSVRGPDPDNAAHYVSGEATGGASSKENLTIAKKQARACIMESIATAGTKKTKAILDAEIAAETAKLRDQIQKDGEVTFIRKGDRFGYFDKILQVTNVGRGKNGAVSLATEIPDPRDRHEKTILVDPRVYDRYEVRDVLRFGKKLP